jgi:hypothetical protein
MVDEINSSWVHEETVLPPPLAGEGWGGGSPIGRNNRRPAGTLELC